MDNSNSFTKLAAEFFGILKSQNYFDFEAHYSQNEKSITLSMHRGSCQYDVWLSSYADRIWNEEVQLAFLIAVEIMGGTEIQEPTHLDEDLAKKFGISGFSQIKVSVTVQTVMIVGTFESQRIVAKLSHTDISSKIIAMREGASLEAQRTGIYCGIDPRYVATELSICSEQTVIRRDFDAMEGHEFEYYCADLLKQNGYSDVWVTKGSGDQGIDIIAHRSGKKYGIQCKCYSADVGNKAVMETYAGISYYGCDIGAVLCNRYYTRAAKDMAGRLGIYLWNRDDLISMLEEVNG